jgi:hypothetical protein
MVCTAIGKRLEGIVGTAAPHRRHGMHPQANAGRSTPFSPNFFRMVCMAATKRLHSCSASRRNEARCALMALDVSGEPTDWKSLGPEPMSHRLAVEDFRSWLLHLSRCCCRCYFSSRLKLVQLGEVTSATVCHKKQLTLQHNTVHRIAAISIQPGRPSL